MFLDTYATAHRCANCGEIIPPDEAAYFTGDVHICEACADTLPPDEMIEGEE